MRWSGFAVSAALVWLAVGTAIEFWGFPLGSYALTFEAESRPVLRDGWWIQALGSLLLTFAFVAFGISAVREKQLPRGMVPMLVLGAAATVFLTPAFILPGLVWILLGATLLRPRWSGGAP